MTRLPFSPAPRPKWISQYFIVWRQLQLEVVATGKMAWVDGDLTQWQDDKKAGFNLAEKPGQSDRHKASCCFVPCWTPSVGHQVLGLAHLSIWPCAAPGVGLSLVSAAING